MALPAQSPMYVCSLYHIGVSKWRKTTSSRVRIYDKKTPNRISWVFETFGAYKLLFRLNVKLFSAHRKLSAIKTRSAYLSVEYKIPSPSTYFPISTHNTFHFTTAYILHKTKLNMLAIATIISTLLLTTISAAPLPGGPPTATPALTSATSRLRLRPIHLLQRLLLPRSHENQPRASSRQR
ncbi:hypothetical protein BC829DRAFT_230879 [Chytridium lagenaria]|nr:hypothetical protein BC829DRAFT_230879 [Chytridium lagenaria]